MLGLCSFEFSYSLDNVVDFPYLCFLLCSQFQTPRLTVHCATDIDTYTCILFLYIARWQHGGHD